MFNIFFILTFILFTQSKTLLVFEKTKDQTEYSQFISILKQQNEEVEIIDKSTEFDLFEYGERIYDNIILLCPNYKFSNSPSDFHKFIDEGGNIVIGLGKKYNEKYSDLLYGLDMEVDTNGNNINDNQHTISIDGKEMIYSSNIHPIQYSYDKTKKEYHPILFRGIGLYVPYSPLTFSLVNGEESSFTNSYPESLFVQQKNLTFVSSLQARNNARVIVSGSTMMFSDKAFNAEINGKKSGNEMFVKDIINWVMKREGVVEMRNFNWKKVGGVENVEYDTQLVINDTIEVNVEMVTKIDGEWKPLNVDDLQIEFKLVDPVIVKYFKRVENGKYSIVFQTPDKFGVYTLLCDYKRPFVTFVEHKEIVPLRTFRLTQTERFVSGAYPFYAACASMLIGFVIFCVIFLSQVDEKKEIKEN